MLNAVMATFFLYPITQTGWFPVNYVAISNRARPAVVPPPAPIQASVQGLPASRARASISQPARPDSFWQQPMAGGSSGGSIGGGTRASSRASLPTAVPPATVAGIGAHGSGGGGSSGGAEMVKALFDYVAQVRTDRT